MPGAIKREASARDLGDIPSGLARHCDRIRVVAVVFARYAIESETWAVVFARYAIVGDPRCGHDSH